MEHTLPPLPYAIDALADWAAARFRRQRDCLPPNKARTAPKPAKMPEIACVFPV
jgi:hypothetical protein